ncbi:MAG TPA: arabinofuranosidase catalytic domain-containing protein [Bryobacteraceae bacterium]
MKPPTHLLVLLTLVGAAHTTAQQANSSRPKGPCDIYAAAGNPCVAAHSTTRALLASYNGPLYEVLRRKDNKTADIGIRQPAGYADAGAQDAFCAGTICVINRIYDAGGRRQARPAAGQRT